MKLASFFSTTILSISLIASIVSAEDDTGRATATSLSTAFESVAKQITPSVVNISAIKRVRVARRGKQSSPDPFFEQFREFFGDDFMDRFGGSPFGGPEGPAQQGLGTGVIFDERGYILTNNHVIGDADEVTVRLHNEKSLKAEVVGSDPRTDLAVIRVKAGNGDLVAAKLGNSDELKIGEWVVACGNPFGLDNTITAGIVSAKGRSIMGGGQFEDFIQTDAAINPGNSGGPLVNLKGEVVGINTAIFSRSGGYMGIGFAIPINMAKNVSDSLVTQGKVVRGWLGIGIQNLSEDLAQSFNYPDTEGALVGHVEAGSPADKAGIKQGDIVVRMDGQKIKNVNQLRNSVASTSPGSKLKLEIVRDGRKESMTAKVGELPAQGKEEMQEEPAENDLGIVVENLTSDLSKRLGSRRRKGVVVTSIEPGSAADKSGLQPRDIIVKIDGAEIENVSDFNSAVESASVRKGIRMVVESQGMDRFVILKSSE
ncbi:MAG: hypothetical protein DCC75_01870 [Proteobacteria bacterium]|nr:MAG: hypothetical protein DCC75_01870 [Pseudomonadota bacterium]